MEKGLVSILSPCYNTGGYIHRLLDSILAQTYSFIEMFVIDDGSTDNSLEIIKSYIPKFHARGYRLSYKYQENAGQSVAINNGLKMISGEFLVWPDSDDYYQSNDAIAKMVFALQNAPAEFAMVRTQEQIVRDGTLEVIGYNGLDVKEQEDASLFYDCLFQKNGCYFCSGAYMVRTGVLGEVTGMSIFTCKNAGQNWQLMLPVLYKYRCLSIKEVLYSVVERQASHSRGQYQGYENSLIKFSVYEQTILETLDRIRGMSSEERAELKKQINAKYKSIRLQLHYSYGKIERFHQEYNTPVELSDNEQEKARRLYYFSKTPFVHIRIFRKVASRIARFL